MKLKATHTLKGALRKRKYSSPLFNNAELSFKQDDIELKYKDKAKSFNYSDLKLVVLDYSRNWNIQLYLLFTNEVIYFSPSNRDRKEFVDKLNRLINDLGPHRFYYLPQHELAGFFPAARQLPKTRSYKELSAEEKQLHKKYIGPYMDPIWVWLMVLIPLSACFAVGVSKLL